MKSRASNHATEGSIHQPSISKFKRETKPAV